MSHVFLSKLSSLAPQAVAVPNEYVTLWQLRAAGLSGAEPLTEGLCTVRQNGKPVKLSSYQGLFGKPVRFWLSSVPLRYLSGLVHRV